MKLKIETIRMIFHSLKQNKHTEEIFDELESKFESLCFKESTIKHWIWILKTTTNRERALRVLGDHSIKYWDEMNRTSSTHHHLPTNQSMPERSRETTAKKLTTFKRKTLEYICECLRQNKSQNSEILKVLTERVDIGLVPINTIYAWISALKSPNRSVAGHSLGKLWIEHWDAIHHHQSGLSNPQSSWMNQEKSTRLVVVKREKEEEEEEPDIIEIKREELEMMTQKTASSIHGANSMETVQRSARVSKKVPKRILGQATLHGQTYFMIKWKGPFEDELGL